MKCRVYEVVVVVTAAGARLGGAGLRVILVVFWRLIGVDEWPYFGLEPVKIKGKKAARRGLQTWQLVAAGHGLETGENDWSDDRWPNWWGHQAGRPKPLPLSLSPFFCFFP